MEIGQQVTVVDGGWTGVIETIDTELSAAGIRFPGRPDLPVYAFEAIRPLRGQAEAAQLRKDWDAYVRQIWRKPVRQLKEIYRAELAKSGMRLLYGGPAGKNELANAIVDLRFPVEQLNESIHVLHHQPGETWSACEWCHPHDGARCECPLGRAS